MSHDPIETIFALYWLSMYPALYLYCGRNAWRGLNGRTTMTHFGFRVGWIARIYGVFYIIALLGLTAFIPFWWQPLKGLTLAELARSFEFRFPADHEMGLLFILLGLLFYLFVWWILKFVQKRKPDQWEKVKELLWFRFYIYSVPSLMVLIGIFIAIGTPISFALGIVIIWTYFAVWVEESRLLDDMMHGSS